MNAPLLPLFRSDKLLAWPKHDKGGAAGYQLAALALRQRYATDAHTAGYSAPSIARRLSKGAAEQIPGGVAMVVQFVDVDTPNHGPATEAWREQERAKIAAVLAALPGGFAFESRGGYKLVWRLAAPILITGPDNAARWRLRCFRFLLSLQRRFGIEGDPACSDWTRIYRLPHTTRPKPDKSPGDAPEDYPTYGDPELPHALAFEPGPADLAADLAEARRLEAAHHATKDEQGKTKGAAPWGAAVKALALEAGEREPERAKSRPADEPAPRPKASHGSRLTREDRERLWVEKALKNEAANLAATTRGGRNNAACKAAFNLGHYAPHLLTEHEIERALLAACERNGLVRDDGRDAALTTIRSAISDGMKTPKRPNVSDDKTRDPEAWRDAFRKARSAQNPNTEGAPMPADQEHAQADEPTIDPWRYHTTDTGNAERLIEQHGADLRYCHPWQKWLVWDGRRWQEDAQAAVKHRAKLTALNIYREAAAITEGTDAAQAKRKDLSSWARKSEQRSVRESMISLAQSEPGIPVLPTGLDRDSWLLNVENGTLDLRTGELRPHRREDLLTKLAPVVYDPKAEAPQFHAFLDSITAGDQELQGFLQRFFGYALTGETTEHVLLNCYGTGSNGKSTLLKAFMTLLGDYAYQAPADLLMVKKGDAHPTDQAGLFKKRLVVCMETPAGRVMDEARMKALTGGDLVTARRMREDFWTFEPTHKLVIGTNHKPSIRTTDHGTWRRQKLVPFTVQIPSEKQDKSLPEKLRSEASGLLRWAVEGCMAWRRDGLGEPQAVREATSAWREESDPVGAFIKAECELGPGFKIPAAALFMAFERWAELEGFEHMTPQAFGRRLTERGLESGRTPGTGARRWLGIRLRWQGKSEPSDDVTDRDRYSGHN